MIAITYTCDYGPETAQGADSVSLPAGWMYVTLAIGAKSTTTMSCPLHQDLIVVESPPVVVVPDPPVVVDQPMPVITPPTLTP